MGQPNLTTQAPFYVPAGRHGVARLSRDGTGLNAIGVGQINNGISVS
jgi:hypothetical protein